MLKSVSSGAEARCEPSSYCRSPSTLPQAGSQDQLKLRPPENQLFPQTVKPRAFCYVYGVAKATTSEDSKQAQSLAAEDRRCKFNGNIETNCNGCPVR